MEIAVAIHIWMGMKIIRYHAGGLQVFSLRFNK